MLSAEGASEADAARNRRLQEKMFAVVKAEKDPAAAEKKLREVAAASIADMSEAQKKAADANPGAIIAQVKAVNTPWFRFFLTYDPRPTLRQVKIPVLALNGELDTQVSSKQNLPEIAKALKAARNKKSRTVELPKLNHLFQTAKTGGFSEYAKIEETISPMVLTQMSDWIAKQTGLKRP
jgi:pimeloyl-ACP methyl ester carboxylesterase